ncbi:MAG: hypothetical protein KatS3mg032_1409 [Cyclobacteriaceae bacterium]|nr:MAG: hypothetical protein KatS3mg032_1409 [Cyclobacteriaceae bacterium]
MNQFITIHQICTTAFRLFRNWVAHNSTPVNNNYKYLNTVLFFITVSVYAQSDNQLVQLANEYYLKGEKQKAVELFREAARSDANIPHIHNNYLNTLVDLALYEEAQKYLARLVKKYPENINYQGDMAWMYFRSGDMARAEKTIRELIEANAHNMGHIKLLADYLTSRSLHEYAIQAYKEVRRVYKNNTVFCLELAMLYRVRGQKEQMVDEYLAYVTQDNYNLQYVKNVLQVLLEPADMDVLEAKLLEHVQANPNRAVYTDLLIWLYVQQKNFFGALVQARALDRRTGTYGEQTAEVARLAVNNGDYEAARMAYQWLLRTYPKGPYYVEARRGLIQTREAAFRQHYPIPRDSVLSLVADYKQFIAENLPDPVALEAQSDLALLYSQWLQQHDQAVQLLQEVIRMRHVPDNLMARAKLNLAEIYTLTGEWWEATLLYSQVEKSMKETEPGYEAKLRNAQLWYYRGDFRLAAEHLDVLKEATSRTIANDAMELSIRIKENLAMDSSGMALKALAKAELLLKQNQTNEALKLMEQIKEGRIKNPEDTAWTTFPNYAILDEVYWLEAGVYVKQKRFDKSIEMLNRIIQDYADDVLCDDAWFKKAEIYEMHLQQAEVARELYLEFINRFPGSVHAAEARKRYRRLRGDFGAEKF